MFTVSLLYVVGLTTAVGIFRSHQASVARHGDNHAHVDHPEICRYEQGQLEETMTTVSSARPTPSRHRLHAALGTFALAVTAAATIAVGAPAIGVAPPPDGIPLFAPSPTGGIQEITDGADPGAPLTTAALTNPTSR